jgi:beta-glucuronidase
VSQFADVLMINRYTAGTPTPGTSSAARGVALQPWTEEYQVALLETYHRVFDRVDAVVGEHVWTFADLATTPGNARVAGNRKGVFARDRSPKAAAFALRHRWHGRDREQS